MGLYWSMQYMIYLRKVLYLSKEDTNEIPKNITLDTTRVWRLMMWKLKDGRKVHEYQDGVKMDVEKEEYLPRHRYVRLQGISHEEASEFLLPLH